jgi:radical SAM superfamily enzyme YgiQ (UPF0313 family)
MFNYPLKYEEPLFRPPSEAYSLIFQVTIGCSWNKCAFCEMYTSKKFRVKNIEDIKDEIQSFAEFSPDTRKIFLADGNAMVLSAKKLLEILENISASFPKLTRTSAYAIAKDVENKSVKELIQLKDAGLKLLYVGIETGDDQLLQMVQKGETSASTIKNLRKVKEAGIKLSVMIINGLGGKLYSDQHAINSAHVVNAIQPEYLSTLVLSFPFGADHYKSRFKGVYQEMNITKLLEEQLLFISHTNLENVVFRSDHASNYLSLKGILSRDKERMQDQLRTAIYDPQNASLREEWQRGL